MDNFGIGIVALLYNADGKLLIGKRKGSHGAGTFSLPGGKIEDRGGMRGGSGDMVLMETPSTRLQMEIQEETGLYVPNRTLRYREWLETAWDDPDKGQQRWVTLFMEAQLQGYPEARVMEPDKCEGWLWADPDEIVVGRYPLFLPLQHYIEMFSIAGPQYRHI